jgi:hypothetical protein
MQDYVVTFNVEELRRVVGSVNTMVGNNEVRTSQTIISLMQ